MRTLCTLGIVAFYALAFGVRSLVQLRRTGKTGFAGVRRGAGALERIAAILLAVTLVLAPLAPWVGTPLWFEGHLVAAVLAGAGIFLTLLAQLQMGDSWRIGVDASEHTELVTTGVFAWVRNPIFSAMLLALVGVALAVPTPLALALPPLLFVALEIQVRLVEEPYLVRTHGDHYLAWAARTGRFVPWLGRMQPRKHSQEKRA